ncbi:TIGR04282 family arsenosugar biosynthesis glycosyltransferase [Bradyrhizobium sp. USDA 10063]
MSVAAIGIICKAPQPGRAKTRLATAIGAVAASELSSCFLRDVAAAIDAVPETLGRRGYGVYAPAGVEHIMRELLPATFGLMLQVGDDLGDVLFGATRDLLIDGHDCVLLVNGDSPTLPTRFLMQAIEILREPGDRMVLGPASDGGYYLIGLKHPHRQLFTRIAWGTETVARSTCERATAIGLATTLLPEWYDIDDVETLGWLRDELSGSSTRFSWRWSCPGEPGLSRGRAADRSMKPMPVAVPSQFDRLARSANNMPPLHLLASIGAALVALTLVTPFAFEAYGDNAFIALSIAAGLLTIVATRLVERAPPDRALLLVLGLRIALRICALLFDPLLSTDIYRYVWDGKVQAAGINPYRYMPADDALAFLRDGTIFPHINRADIAVTIYPPVAQFFFLLSRGSAKA